MNWKLWIATTLSLGAGLWFARAVIPEPDRFEPVPACAEPASDVDRAAADRPASFGRPDAPCQRDAE